MRKRTEGSGRSEARGVTRRDFESPHRDRAFDRRGNRQVPAMLSVPLPPVTYSGFQASPSAAGRFVVNLLDLSNEVSPERRLRPNTDR